MHTNVLMRVSALVLATIGAAATFAPQEMMVRYGGNTAPGATLLVQMAGGAYLGFAMLNWMARENLIGGIYSRPVGMGNFLHFTIVALGMIRVAIAGLARAEVLAAAAVFTVLAMWFGVVIFTAPGKAQEA